MTQFNNNGYVIKQADGTLLADSHVSAYSHRRAVTHAQLEAVIGAPGLYVRIATREIAQVTPRQRADVHSQARAWYRALAGAASGVSHETPEPDTAAQDAPPRSAEEPRTAWPGVQNETPDMDEHPDLPSGVTHGAPEVGEYAELPGDDELSGVSNGAPEPDDIDAITLEELQARARDLDIPGRSKMSKAALYEAVRAAEAD